MKDFEDSIEGSNALCKEWAEAAERCHSISIKVTPGSFYIDGGRPVIYQLTAEEKERVCHILRFKVIPRVVRMPMGLCIDYACFSYMRLHGEDGQVLVSISSRDINGDGPDGLWRSPAKVCGKDARFLNELTIKVYELFKREHDIKR